jgi:hypothetical protein
MSFKLFMFQMECNIYLKKTTQGKFVHQRDELDGDIKTFNFWNLSFILYHIFNDISCRIYMDDTFVFRLISI